MRPDLYPTRLSENLLASMLCLVIAGCSNIHGRPGPGPDVPRPEEVVDFHTLYKQNCAGCHGVEGRGGAAIALANPVYLSYAGEDNVARVISTGVPEHLMPPFAKTAGGMLTDSQVRAIAHGIMTEWSKPTLMGGQSIPVYSPTTTGDSGRGQRAFVASCGRCHGATGEGSPRDLKTGTPRGSIVDPAYLALVSDQYLRDITVAGVPDRDMPDWRSDSAQALTDQEIADIVAWLASKRIADPGQPYSSQP